MRNFFDDPEGDADDRDFDTVEPLDLGAREARTARRAHDLLSDTGGALVYFGED